MEKYCDSCRLLSTFVIKLCIFLIINFSQLIIRPSGFFFNYYPKSEILITELISTLNPVVFVPHHSSELDELRILLASNTVDSETQILSSIDSELLKSNPLRVLSISIALIEASNWPHASQAIALYLQHYPSDENAIALLAFSLASTQDFEQASIILNRAFSFLNQKQQVIEDADSEQAQALEQKVQTFKLLEELILKKESPSELIFSDKATLRLPLPLPNLSGPTLSQDASELHYELADEILDSSPQDLILDDMTFRDVKLQDYLQRIDHLAEQEAKLKAQQNALPRKKLDSAIAHESTISGNHDTQVHLLSDPDDDLIEDQMTEILKDAEAREQTTNHSYYPNSLVFDSSNHFESSGFESTLSVHENHAKQDTGFISQIEYLSDFSEVVDTDLSERSVLANPTSSLAQIAFSQVDSENMTFDSTERMKSLSNTMMEEERQRIASILNHNNSTYQPQKSDDEDALIVQTSTEVPASPDLSMLQDPLLYPETLTPPPNSPHPVLSHGHVPKAEVKVPPIPKREAANQAHSAPQSVVAQASTPSLESPFRRAKPPLPPIPSARHKQAHFEPNEKAVVSNENNQLPTRELNAPSPQSDESKRAPNTPLPSSHKSPLERLSAGELNVPYVAPLSPHSPPTGYQRAQQVKKTTKPNPKSRLNNKGQQSSWGLWIMIALASYFSLMSAFHYKSEHLLHHSQLTVPLVEASSYKGLQVQLTQTLSHPIGKSIDWLSIALPESELNQKRQKLIHQLAWVTSCRWVLFGEESQKDEALKVIRLALSKSPNLDEGRAALGLAFIAFNQFDAALPIIQALPNQSPYKEIALTRLYLESGQLNKAKQLAKTSLTSQSLNTWLIDQVIYLEALDQDQPFSQAYQNLNLDQGLKEFLYSPQHIPKDRVIVNPKLTTYLKQQAPQKQRNLLDLLMVELIKRRDRIGLQTLAQDLSLSSSSPSILLLPALSLALLELNFESAEPIYRSISERNQTGLISNHDAAQAKLLWALFTGHPITPERFFSFDTALQAKELGHFSGAKVAKLVTDKNEINSSLKYKLEALSYLYHSQWPSLERVSQSLAPKAKKVFQKIAQSYLSHHYQAAKESLETLRNTKINFLYGIFTQNIIMHGVITNAFDPGGQAAYHFQKHAQSEIIPALKWLSQAWHCHLLSESSQLGLLRNVCSAATRLNPKDYRSTQVLAYTWLEVGQVSQAKATMEKVPSNELSPQGHELYLRLNYSSLQKPNAPKSNPNFTELLSAEMGLRLSSFLSFVEKQINRLSRNELYRATWVAKYLGPNPQFFTQLLQSAIKRGSLLARLEYARQSLFMSNPSNTLKSSISASTRIEANAESETATFISLYDTLMCLAQHQSLDFHHFQPAMSQPVQLNKIIQGIKTRIPPQPCRNLISESLSSFKNLTSAHLPLVKLSFAQLLISLGYEERAEVVLKNLISQEPTLIEARVAYSLLLLRISKSPNLKELKQTIAPIENELYQARGLQALHSKLREYGVIK